MSNPPPPPPPRWVVELNTTPAARPKNTSLVDPPGFSGSGRKGNSSKKDVAAPRKAPTTEETDTLKMKKAWELAIAPAKALPMNAIGMYMSGNSLQIFSVMMVFMCFKTPLLAVLNIQATFARLESPGTKDKMLLVKITFVLMNLLAVALGTWKVNQMGLLPTTSSDWLAWESARDPLERAFPDFAT
ncbi:hypothetical protein EJ08DRAFT_647306 [Tothia fuscella]|uniref:ER membrane protein complex subunit 4 n=1 Tax=Tothia fuscella TaxID=1048955 RepID=A0A9P4U262_9PEZI|nr:hypothetical protein EJ08DRAFT_647306 [Tothia fuscella]